MQELEIMDGEGDQVHSKETVDASAEQLKAIRDKLDVINDFKKTFTKQKLITEKYLEKKVDCNCAFAHLLKCLGFHMRAWPLICFLRFFVFHISIL